MWGEVCRKGDMSTVGNGEGEDMVGRGPRKVGWIELGLGLFFVRCLVLKDEWKRWVCVWTDRNHSFFWISKSCYVAGQ